MTELERAMELLTEMQENNRELMSALDRGVTAAEQSLATLERERERGERLAREVEVYIMTHLRSTTWGTLDKALETYKRQGEAIVRSPKPSLENVGVAEALEELATALEETTRYNTPMTIAAGKLKKALRPE